MSEKTVPETPLSRTGYCPYCGKFDPRRTHETMQYDAMYYVLCRCLKCWKVYWAGNVSYLPIEGENKK